MCRWEATLCSCAKVGVFSTKNWHLWLITECFLIVTLKQVVFGKMFWNICIVKSDFFFLFYVLLRGSADSEGDISWSKGDEDVDEDRHVVEKIDESSSKLTLKKVELDDAGKYTCVFENDHGTKKMNYQIYVYRRFPSSVSCSWRLICSWAHLLLNSQNF